MKPRVVLVEDEADARTSLAAALERAGYACVPCATKAEALAAVHGSTFIDVIVTDIVLGADDQGGLDLLLELRAAQCEIPVVVITAFADLARVKRALNGGASFLLEKPFRAQQLIDVVRQMRGTLPDIGHQVERTLLDCGLTEKERTIARHLLKGLTSLEIASLENNSDKTVRQHITQIYAKCGVATRGAFFHFVLPF